MASARKKSGWSGWLAYGVLLVAGAALYVICREYLAELPFWMPWEFSWPAYLVTVLTLIWFARGLAQLKAADRPAFWRIACFVLGIAADYVVLQTHVDYYAQHMFFVHRWAHFVLHHAGAFFIALGMAGPVVRAGMPDFLRPLIDARPVQRVVGFMQHPAIAPVLFIGLLYFWLFPAIHTYVMLDRDLYDVMNWTMAINGIFFWCLILDPRPKPPARISIFMRAMLILAIELPQMVLGALLSFSKSDYYPVYSICGRVLDMTALNDQHYGGLIIWLPGTLTSFAAMICVLMALRINEEKAEQIRLAAKTTV